ncbi:MAG: sensor histidine kinase [Treponema sp.]|jgi:nitrogen fixation/metabolism regulation signal transduction histidine kinase|nr:sensor histidine kinase [Treponema sp.]
MSKVDPMGHTREFQGKVMKIAAQPQVIDLPVLILLYVFSSVIIAYLLPSFLSMIMEYGRLPGKFELAVFCTIPAVLMLYLAASLQRSMHDLVQKWNETHFQTRLLMYFTLIILFTVIPIVVITALSLRTVTQFWYSGHTKEALAGAQSLALDAYTLHWEKFEQLIAHNNLEQGESSLPDGISSIQDFQKLNGVWVDIFFSGETTQKLQQPPSNQQDTESRVDAFSIDTLYYTVPTAHDTVRVISYQLGNGFDKSLNLIDSEQNRYQKFDFLMENIQYIVAIYYTIFFLPILFMTFIIAISFTHKIAQPINKLAEVTHIVAEGNFNIHLIEGKTGIAPLIHSFNAIVRELERSKELLSSVNKVSMWQDMANRLAHEIKNPLTPIRLSAERLLRRARNDPDHVLDIVEYSSLAIIQEVDSLIEMLSEFKVLVRPIEPSESGTELLGCIQEIINAYQESYPKIQFDITQVKACVVVVDRRRITQVLTNLIVNAIDAMSGNGMLEIVTNIGTKKDTQFCRLSIHDTGKGISEQDQISIFEPYFTTKETGTGLGLSIVEKIINDHGGSIWVNSVEGIGTTFFIDLPVY